MNINIDFVLTDEIMSYMPGSVFTKSANECFKTLCPSVYLASSIDSEEDKLNFQSFGLKDIYKKPLSYEDAASMIDNEIKRIGG